MSALPEDHARYLVAELSVLASELRDPRSSLTRAQLAALAERARDDAACLTGCHAAPVVAPARPPIPEGGAKIIPLFGR